MHIVVGLVILAALVALVAYIFSAKSKAPSLTPPPIPPTTKPPGGGGSFKP